MKNVFRNRLAATVTTAILAAGALLAPLSVQAQKSEPTIVEAALAVNAQSGEFSTLIAAVVAAGLVDELNGNRHYTVFAPTDAAFAKLGLTAENIATALPLDALTNILLYHVAPGDRFATDVLASSQIRMLNRSFTRIDPAGFINASKIIATDVNCGNGVIHVIDTVLIP